MHKIISKRKIIIISAILLCGIFSCIFFTGCTATHETERKVTLIDNKRIADSPYTKYVKGESGHTLTKTTGGTFVYKDNTVYNNTGRMIVPPRQKSSPNFGPQTVEFGPEN